MTAYNRDELVAEGWPFCDLCDEPQDDGDGENDWNGETGNHLSCETRQHDVTCRECGVPLFLDLSIRNGLCDDHAPGGVM